ncbi:MAG: TA system antitoxin ParD family protein [Acidimicrobiales bacterium]
MVGEVQSRSAAQQVAHWARIGREIEAAAGISHREIAAVLDGSGRYDALSAKEQAVVRAEWAARMAARRQGLDLSAELAARDGLLPPVQDRPASGRPRCRVPRQPPCRNGPGAPGRRSGGQPGPHRWTRRSRGQDPTALPAHLAPRGLGH